MRIKGDLATANDFLNRSFTAKKHSLGIEHKDTIFIGLAHAEVLLEQAKTEGAKFILKEIVENIGLENTINSSKEMLAILGEDRPIDDGIPEKMDGIILSL